MMKIEITELAPLSTQKQHLETLSWSRGAPKWSISTNRLSGLPKAIPRLGAGSRLEAAFKPFGDAYLTLNHMSPDLSKNSYRSQKNSFTKQCLFSTYYVPDGAGGRGYSSELSGATLQTNKVLTGLSGGNGKNKKG